MRILFHLWLRLPIFVYFFNFYLCFSMREKVEPICVPKKDLNVKFYGKTYNNDANGIINFVDDKTNIECLYDFKCGDCTLGDAINTYENALRKEFAEIGMDCKLSNIVCNQTLDIYGDIDDSSLTYEVCLELEAIFNNSVTVFDHDNNIDITDIYLRYNNGYDKSNNFFVLFIHQSLFFFSFLARASCARDAYFSFPSSAGCILIPYSIANLLIFCKTAYDFDIFTPPC